MADDHPGLPHRTTARHLHRLIHHFESGHDELFDLRNDPSESNDLTKSNPERSATLRESLLTRLATSGARLPHPKP